NRDTDHERQNNQRDQHTRGDRPHLAIKQPEAIPSTSPIGANSVFRCPAASPGHTLSELKPHSDTKIRLQRYSSTQPPNPAGVWSLFRVTNEQWLTIRRTPPGAKDQHGLQVNFSSSSWLYARLLWSRTVAIIPPKWRNFMMPCRA